VTRTTTPVVEDEAPLDDDRWYDDDHEQMPPRPRRRLLAPVPLALLGVLLLAGGFIGGVLVQKGAGASSSAGLPSGLPANVRAALGGGAGGAAAGGASGQTGGSTTTGQVASVHGSVLYVTGSDGTTIKVTVPKSATVSRNAKSSAAAIHPGDTVVVQGSANASGAVTAGTVSATAAGVSSPSPFGGGGAPGASGGSTSTGTSSGGDVNSLFGG
jgi:hypothetical protein